MTKRNLKLPLLAAAILIAVIALVSLVSWSSKTFAVRDIIASKLGPVATFEKRIDRSPLNEITSIGSNSRIWVFRRNQWIELQPAEVQTRVYLSPVVVEMVDGRRRARAGYTLEVKVPVCQRWRIEEELYETRRIGFKKLGFNLSHTNRWRSDEFPGWSEIRQAFNDFSAGK